MEGESTSSNKVAVADLLQTNRWQPVISVEDGGCSASQQCGKICDINQESCCNNFLNSTMTAMPVIREKNSSH